MRGRLICNDYNILLYCFNIITTKVFRLSLSPGLYAGLSPFGVPLVSRRPFGVCPFWASSSLLGVVQSRPVLESRVPLIMVCPLFGVLSLLGVVVPLGWGPVDYGLWSVPFSVVPFSVSVDYGLWSVPFSVSSPLACPNFDGCRSAAMVSMAHPRKPRLSWILIVVLILDGSAAFSSATSSMCSLEVARSTNFGSLPPYFIRAL
jgi:hypothetical protein